MGIHPAPAIELLLVAASGRAFLVGVWFDSAKDRAEGIWLLTVALVFALGVAFLYDRQPLRRH